jgi:conjugal transfer mating pair stabilization protein TraN
MGLENSGLQAAYETLRTPVTQAWTEVNKGLITAWDTLAGTSTGAAEELAKEGIMTAFEDAMMETVVDWTTEVFGAAARDALFSQSLETGAWQLGGGEAMLGTMLGWIMWIYMIYQIVMILIQIIWACEQKEFELTSKRELKTCHHVGSYCASKALGACIEKRESYCCFNSPLSRILQEQMRPQLGRDWGTPEEPECGPVLASDLAEVDFSQIDLSEWTGMLYNADLLPSVDDMNIENLTGDGSNWDTGTGRDNAAERALERLNGIDADDIRHQALEEIR